MAAPVLAWLFFLSLREWTANCNQWCQPRAPLVGRIPCQSIRQGFVSLVIYDIEGNGQKDNMGGGGMARKAWECQGGSFETQVGSAALNVLWSRWWRERGRKAEERELMLEREALCWICLIFNYSKEGELDQHFLSKNLSTMANLKLNLSRSLKWVSKGCISYIIFLWSSQRWMICENSNKIG